MINQRSIMTEHVIMSMLSLLELVQNADEVFTNLLHCRELKTVSHTHAQLIWTASVTDCIQTANNVMLTATAVMKMMIYWSPFDNSTINTQQRLVNKALCRPQPKCSSSFTNTNFMTKKQQKGQDQDFVKNESWDISRPRLKSREPQLCPRVVGDKPHTVNSQKQIINTNYNIKLRCYRDSAPFRVHIIKAAFLLVGK